MRALKGLTYFAILLSVLLDARARGADAPSVEQCPGAATWTRTHPAFAQSPQSESGDNKRWLADPKSENLARSVAVIDAANLTWLRQLISEKGFPTAAQVGSEGVHLAWILLQHADQDPKLQSQLLPVLEQRFAAGELAANDLARITDRVLVASGRPQRYGTQFDWFSGAFKLPEPSRLTEIDSARSHVGLMPLADYVCTIRKAREKVK